ncbi:MAG: efflux RND transporter periplasmic adaptor subunit [Pseudomonadales bacterium]|nr:efflux RND transporter periplasmic adaptor subunit [Pseudomonadales bacterium]
MSSKNLSAILIAIGMAIWIFSGALNPDVLIADDSIDNIDNIDSNDGRALETIPYVRVVSSKATLRDHYLEVNSHTMASRTVQVKAEVSGRVEQIAVNKGMQVNAGDLLCRLALDTRLSDVDQTKAELKSARLEYQGVLDLKRQGLQSDMSVARAQATLARSRASAKRAELSLAKTNIVAPFAGVVEHQAVEVGDFLEVGKNCITLMEIDPVLVVGQVAEKRVGSVALGSQAQIKLITGKHLTGVVSFVGRSPDEDTRTYLIEVTIKAPGSDIRAGLTAKMELSLGREAAHLISAASLVLDDKGMVGVRTVDEENVVRFTAVQIVAEEPSGIWVRGLADEVNLITVGQEEVFAGQIVKMDLTPLGTIVNR